MNNIDPQKALTTLHQIGQKYAAAKANRIHIEESLRSVKALEMNKSAAGSAAAQERDAYASDAYRTALDGLKEAVEQEEGLRWRLVTAQCALDVWRSLEASNRGLDRRAA